MVGIIVKDEKTTRVKKKEKWRSKAYWRAFVPTPY
jgi:hypothetical protein